MKAKQGFLAVLALFAFVSIVSAQASNFPFLIGAGIGDVTGPAAQVGMMGYVQFSQTTAGIHYRLRARAFVIQDKSNSQRLTYVNLDLCFATSAVKNKVLAKLNKLYPGNLYNDQNVLLSATHTHAGPGGFAWYSMYLLSTYGFQFGNRDAIVDGIVRAVVKAHSSMKSAQILVNQGELVTPQSNINRSPTAYANNPAAERAQYPYNVDKTMTLLKFVGQDGSEIGTLNWFPVHGTSMNNQNHFISGDNKGYAEYLFERAVNGNSTLPGTGPFVAAFGQTNEGDVSPNTRGAFCNNGLPCEVAHSTCGGTSEGCHGYGPGKTDFLSNQIIGDQQFQFAMNLYQNAATPVEGGVTGFRHTYVDMTKVSVSPQYTGLKSPVTTCVGAIGDATAAGTTDGPGDFDFRQGTNSSHPNSWWNLIAKFLIDPPPAQVACQLPKPILVWVGGIQRPAAWAPDVLPIQIFRIGHIFILAVPAEFTTMSGRRLRNTVQQVLLANGAPANTIVVIAGLANDYSQYVATPEEYRTSSIEIQRYEGGSTLYGPYTLPAYQQEFAALSLALIKNQTFPSGPKPTDWEPDMVFTGFLHYSFRIAALVASSVRFTVQTPVIEDAGPVGKLKQDVNKTYSPGSTVTAIFYSGDPRNNYHDEGTFLTVERLSGSNWTVVANDGSYETLYHWQRLGLAESLATITWNIPLDTPPGTYRIGHFGDRKPLFSSPVPFVGYSSEFQVTQ